ncbi:MAG: NAD(P)/FAD-dependent oxidoreductase [Anaerolineae bacterium]|nr:NAD(P)/FAD-dependent oxidoreductase [Anaerolineae bacterium]
MNVGIIGGGIMGLSLGYFLAQQGIETEIFEASPTPGGLAGPLILEDGTAVDRFYHAILSSDGHLRELCTELNLVERLNFRETKMGFYYQNKIHSMNSVVEFLRFPPLGWIDRFRLGLTVLYAQFVRNWHQLEGVNVEQWLLRLSGRRTYENIWRPLLKAKFDGGFDNTPATYIWSRLVRMKSTRGGANQKEEAGHLIGGYITLLQAMTEKIEAAGGKIHLGCPAQKIEIEGNRAHGIRLRHEVRSFDAIVVTSQLPIFRRLIPDAGQEYLSFLDKTDYLGLVCPLLVLDRPLTGYWTLNITNDNIPFTGIIETTTYIDPQYVGGHHLVYLPKYTAPGSPWQQKSDDEIRLIWLGHLQAMFPHFDPARIRHFVVNRARYVEPLHGLNAAHLIPPVKTPVQNLYLATTAQIYPALTNGESVTRHARQVAEIVAANGRQ